MTDQRERMLADLLGAMHRIHRRRRVLGRTGAALVLTLLAGTAWVVIARQAPPTGPVLERPEPFRIVRHTQRTGLVRTIGDDELVEWLVEIDRPAGLIRVEGRTRLTSVVTDVEIGGSRYDGGA